MDTKNQATRLIKIIEEVNGYSREELDKQRHTLFWFYDISKPMDPGVSVEECIKSIYSHVLMSTDFYDDLYEYFHAKDRTLKRITLFKGLKDYLFRKVYYFNDEDYELMIEFNKLLSDVYHIDLTKYIYTVRQKIDINYLCEKYNITDLNNEEDLSTTSW